MRRLLLSLLLAAAALAAAAALSACGGDDVERARDEVAEQVDSARERVDEARRTAQEQGRRVRDRLRRILDDIEQVIPRARETSPQVRSQGRDDPRTIDGFMTGVLENIDRYWSTTLRAAGRPEPSVRYSWVPPGARQSTACGDAAADDAAFYCPADDTIYVGQRFAAAVFAGVARGFPGERAGHGPAAGDFAVAYVLAHEYAHNLQQEFGVFARRTGPSARPFELQADCLAGTWANSAFEEGLLEPGDLEEATNAALAVGDFDIGNAQHHGTPEERQDALLVGYRSGNPSACVRFVPAS